MFLFGADCRAVVRVGEEGEDVMVPEVWRELGSDPKNPRPSLLLVLRNLTVLKELSTSFIEGYKTKQ